MMVQLKSSALPEKQETALKVAVRSFDANVDPVGTCVGPKGQRVQAIVNELKR